MEPVNVFGGYRAAKERHRALRQEAYDSAREDAVGYQGIGSELRFADIDAGAIEVWHQTWAGRTHESEVGGWNWPGLVQRLPHRAAVLPLAIGYGTDLCGLSLGRLSRHRAAGVRHTITLTHAERRPEPPEVPLRGLIIPLATAVARNYAVALGASRVRLAHPDRNLLWYYELLGFEVAWQATRPVYCEQEI
jgi:hypothetical protein